ncbi:MAG: ATP-binding protein [Candidatus Omnitrophica bacterium]|nr:ATP-binding protein [Candidatus Omnitrophota bacterium]
MKNRALIPVIEKLCFQNQKMAFVSGPRQCGKTTLAKMLLKRRGYGQYYNYDETEFRRLWTKDPKSVIPTKDIKTPIIVLDEVHKAKLWKRSLKGIYDTANPKPDILVTGSSRLNIYKKGSDSLMGRYFNFRLHPFTLGELESDKISEPKNFLNILTKKTSSSKKRRHTLQKLLEYSGFPEPFLKSDNDFLRLWRRGRTEKIIREDLRDLTRTLELSQIEMLVSLLPERIGSFLSRASLKTDLEVSFDTIRRWLVYLNELYYLFEIKPYSQRISESLKKEGKSYLWDYSEIPNEPARFENLVACHLLKFCHYWTDSGKGDYELFCLRDKRKREIDFLICENGRPWLPVEVKINNTTPSENWAHFLKQLPCKQGLQLVLKPNVWKLHNQENMSVLVASASDILHLFP